MVVNLSAHRCILSVLPLANTDVPVVPVAILDTTRYKAKEAKRQNLRCRMRERQDDFLSSDFSYDFDDFDDFGGGGGGGGGGGEGEG